MTKMANANELGCTPDDPLTSGLLPVVIHQLNNATQLLANFQALLSLGGAEELLRSRSGDLADTAREVHQLGYVLAVIASSSGADLLLERREERGLAWIFDTVRDGLRRDGRDLAESPTPLPLLAPQVGEGWELPWAFAALLYSAGQLVAAGERVEWALEPLADGWQMSLPGIRATDLDELSNWICERLRGAERIGDSADFGLRFPAAWLREAATDAASTSATS